MFRFWTLYCLGKLDVFFHFYLTSNVILKLSGMLTLTCNSYYLYNSIKCLVKKILFSLSMIYDTKGRINSRHLKLVSCEIWVQSWTQTFQLNYVCDIYISNHDSTEEFSSKFQFESEIHINSHYLKLSSLKWDTQIWVQS